MIIYKVTNLVNSKVYVGQTNQPIKERWRHHKIKGNALFGAIKKYGEYNFKIEQLDSADTIDELNVKEIYWIVTLNSISPNGYNIKLGGGGGGKWTEETKNKFKQSKKLYFENKNNLKKMSEKMKLSLLKNPHNREKLLKGFKTKEHKRNFQESSKAYLNDPDINNKMAISKGCKKFKCNETNEIFISKSEAAKKFNIHRASIHKALKNKLKIKKYSFSYIES